MEGFKDILDKVYELDFVIKASFGEVPGVSFFRKFSYLPNVQAATGERDIWEYGSTTFGNISYTYPTDGTAPVNTISSSSALDTDELLVQGLDIQGFEVTQVVKLEGQSKITLKTPLWRCYRLTNLAANNQAQRGVGFIGNVYAYEDTPTVAGVPTDKTKVKAFLNDGNNSTLMSMYTIPKGKVGIIQSTDARLVQKGTGSAIIKAYSRLYGYNFTVLDVGALSASGTSSITVPNPGPRVIPEKTDVLLTMDGDTNGMGASAVMYFLLFDKEIWGIK